MPVPTVLGRKTALVAALVLLAGGLAAWMLSQGGARIDPGDAAQVALGKTVYAANCASCHGAALEGQPDWRERKPDGRLPAPPHDVSGHTWHHPAETLFGIVKDGMAAYAPPGYESDMPAFGGTLSDEEIRAVLAFIASRWPENVRTRWMAAGVS
ncbi:cytochrome c [Skermanella mucosa]|uniref:c-type cytochrome n=1 Tax=Skermanella mucosa TaxID=1789672 RepID=UPI00192B9383|nr:cytochrome c [Skermanella mucosa]UEM19089.1 cytochrome c [Skermanella mucosa]